MDISRNPAEYTYSTHAVQQYKYRKIGKDVVHDAIRNGKVTPAAESHQREFVYEIPHLENPIGVIVDCETKTIITVEFVKD